jgi:hypothetical protein
MLREEAKHEGMWRNSDIDPHILNFAR